MKTTNDIEQLLKPKATYHASPGLKERVMDEAAKTAAPKRGNNQKWWWMGIAASLLIVAGVGWMLLNHKETKVSESGERMAEKGSQMLTDSSAINPTAPLLMEDTKPDTPLMAQVTESPKPRKHVRRQTVPHKTAVEVSHQEELLETEEECATPVDGQDNDELEAILNSVRSNQSAISAEDEYRHMNVRVFTANIRIRNKQEN
ncbi:MAG: hypothetical protein K5899_04740 [Bacteroidaceae bacterium]|nr:hypothetical protein [Bacteroidaceae bacterium]